MKLIKIDEQGLFIEDVITDIFIDDGFHISTPCRDGFYRPKWNGAEWVEGKTQEEIDIILNAPAQPSETEIMQGKIEALEAENLELMVSISELYETIIGGV